MSGILYGIGVGPGDPELLTLKAVRLLRECDVVMAPGEDVRESIAYQIAVQAVPEIAKKELVGVPMPMTRDKQVLQRAHERAVDLVTDILEQGKTAAFLNLGDVTIYASFLYIHRGVLSRGLRSELVNGVPSFCAAAARLGTGLVEGAQELHVLSQPGQIAEGLRLSGTKVIMKMGKNMEQAKSWLMASDADVMMVERCGMTGERVFRSVDEIEEDAGYYSLVLVKERQKNMAGDKDR